MQRTQTTLVFAVIAAILFSGQALAQEKSSPQALRVFKDAANYQNKELFELAAEEWTRFLKQYPTDPLVVKARHYRGVCYVQLNRLDEAIVEFQQILKARRPFELAEETRLQLAWAYYTQGQGSEGKGGKPAAYPAAARAFKELREKFPQGRHADRALFFEAESNYLGGQKTAAIPLYQKLLSDFPKSNYRAEAGYALGAAYDDLGKFAQARAEYDRFLAAFPQHELVAEVRLRKAESLLQLKDFAAAAKVFEGVASLPGFESADYALYRQAYCVAQTGDLKSAAALYAKLPTAFPQSKYRTEAPMQAGRCYYNSEQYKEAVSWFSYVIKSKFPDAGEAAHWVNQIYLKQSQPAKAIRLTDAMLARLGDDAYVVALKLDRAEALLKIPGKESEAAAAFAKVAAEHANHALAPQALYDAAFTFLELRQFDKAIVQADIFLKKYGADPLAADVRRVGAECSLQAGKLADAEKLFRELIASSPNHPDLPSWMLRLGHSLLLQGQDQACQAYLQSQFKHFTTPRQIAEARYLQGAAQFHLEQYEQAGASLQASLAASADWPQAEEAWLLLSQSWRKRGRAPESIAAAIAAAKHVLDDFPQPRLRAEALYRMGEAYYSAQQFPQALAQYQQVLDAHGGGNNAADSPFAVYALYGKGWTLLKQSQFAPAAAALTTLLETHPEHELALDAHFARAMCRRQLGEHKAAIEDCTAYLNAPGELLYRFDALYERGLAEAGLKDFKRAAATFSQVLAEQPQYANADKVLYELAWAQKSSGQDAAALKTFTQLASKHASSPLAAEAAFYVGEDHYTHARYADALQSYAAAKKLAKEPTLQEQIGYKTGWAYFKLGQFDQAQREFEQQAKSQPQGALAREGRFMRAECLFKRKDYAAAYGGFQQTQQAAPVNPTVDMLALLHGGQSAAQLKRWREGIAMLEQIGAKFPDSPYLPEALYEQGWAWQNLKDDKQALQRYEQAAQISREEPGARARFMMGEIYFSQKDYPAAIKQFQRVMYGFGGADALASVKNWQAKSSYEAGRCLEVQIRTAKNPKKAKLLAEARKFYTYVAEKHPRNALAATAQSRLKELAKLR